MTDPADLVDRVDDLPTFIAFVRALEADRRGEVANERERPSNSYGLGAAGWENVTLADFLAAALRWAEDAEHSPQQVLPDGAASGGLAAFLNGALLPSLRASGWDERESGAIEEFLDATATWAESLPKGGAPVPSDWPSWRAIATFLYCGKIYE